MSFGSEIMGAVRSAVSDALESGRKEWRTRPHLYQAAMLTGESVRSAGPVVSGELDFEMHQKKVPVSSRDMYGVAGGMKVLRTVHQPGAADATTLMQKTGDVMASSFEDSLERRL